MRRASESATPAAYSLRRRLTLTVLGASSFMWLVCMALVVQVAWRETSDVFDDALKEGAQLALVLGDNLERRGALAAAPDEQAGNSREAAKLKLYYQLVAPDGRVLRRAEQAPATPFTGELTKTRGHLDTWTDGQAWRVYVLRAEGRDFQVQIGQPWAERLDLLDEIAEDLLWPALLLLLLLGGFCWFGIRRLLRPIDDMARRIAAKSPGDLQPVASVGQPRELQPVLQAFNLVLARLAQALNSERRFTADAAHELRTPLAALRMRIQLLQRQAAAPVEGLQPLRDDVDRCTALVENLLLLARLDPQDTASLPRQPVAIAALFERLEAATSATAAARSSRLVFENHAAAVSAQPELLHSALRNLIDNALRYSPPGSRVLVVARTVAEGVCIGVSDDGPGVSAADRSRLGERFFRVLGSGVAGSGLGLSIAARVAILHGTALRFGPGIDGKGLGVEMRISAA